MQVVESAYKPVAVCIPSGGMTRYLLFETSLEGLCVPDKTCIYRIASASPAKNRNDAVRLAGPEVSHFFFMDDDHHFDMDLVLRLLRWNVPVVGALVSFSKPPFHPVLFKGETHENGRKQFISIPWSELDGRLGLYPVFAAAGAGILVRRDVFEKIPDPWFALGRYTADECAEDMYFYEQCRNAGFPIYVDLDSPVGHFAPVAAWPVRREDGKWTIELMWETGKRLRLGRSDQPIVGGELIQGPVVSASSPRRSAPLPMPRIGG